MTVDADHWDGVYAEREETALTWFEAEPALSLHLIEAHVPPTGSVIDIGGGASRLVDGLIDRGYRDVTVLDLSETGPAASRARLGRRADRVTWLQADVTRWRPERRYDLWHDRAAFHFLTETEDQRAYLAAMAAALRVGGHAIVMTFADDGPETCSGLPVARYAPEALADRMETLEPGAFLPVSSERWIHVTPKGRQQRFQASVFRRR
jgi:SAM-dependent methyltransferase